MGIDVVVEEIERREDLAYVSMRADSTMPFTSEM
jgi:hypothetical protein